MRYFLILSLCCWVAACSKPTYPPLEQAKYQRELRQSSYLTPEFDKALYRCVVDGKTFLKSYHFSGLLFIKKTDDRAINVVFQNEMGMTYFDFSWDKNDVFRVNQIMPQFNKPALIQTLQKDFELLLRKGLPKYANGQYHFNGDRDTTYVRFPLNNGYVFYKITADRQLTGIENADEKRKVVVFKISSTPLKELPEQILIQHLRANFTIDLKKIPDDAIE